MRTQPIDTDNTYMRQQTRPSLVLIKPCPILGTRALSEPTMAYWLLDPGNKCRRNPNLNHHFRITKMHLEISSAKWRQFCFYLNVWTNTSQGLTGWWQKCNTLSNISTQQRWNWYVELNWNCQRCEQHQLFTCVGKPTMAVCFSDGCCSVHYSGTLSE